jgi:ubiquinone/menaquinone biosynthesis C-methylase UbiE
LHSVDTDSQYHNDLIIDQFTKQAIPFTQNASHSAEYAIKRLVRLSNVSKKDIVLDVACGSGLVSCELAKVAHHIIGIDITPAMIEQANLLRQEKNLCNIKYEIGDVTHLPYGDASFSIVVTRYSFHHLVDPSSVLGEMKRVCMRKGRVIVIDATPASDKVDMYNYVEKLRDPSHVKALTFAKLLEMFKQIGLTIINTDSYGVDMELERLLQSSFPNPGDKNKIRQLFIKDVQNNLLGVNSHYIGTEIHFTYPTSMIIAQKS